MMSRLKSHEMHEHTLYKNESNLLGILIFFNNEGMVLTASLHILIPNKV